MPEIPRKSSFRITEVCRYTDTQPYVLRFWESEFPQLAPRKNSSGQRVYRKRDVDLVLRIKKLLYEDEYTIAGARKLLEEEGAETPDTAAAPPKAEAREAEPDQPAGDGIEGAPLFRSAGATVDRDRYESAVAEVHRLRRAVEQLTAERDELEVRGRDLEDSFRRRQSAAERATRRLERLLARLEGPGAADPGVPAPEREIDH